MQSIANPPIYLCDLLHSLYVYHMVTVWSINLFLDETGLQLDDCYCPDACKVQAYGADLSYAALSELGVSKILSANTSTLSQKYRRALEIQEVFMRLVLTLA